MCGLNDRFHDNVKPIYHMECKDYVLSLWHKHTKQG